MVQDEKIVAKLNAAEEKLSLMEKEKLRIQKVNLNNNKSLQFYCDLGWDGKWTRGWVIFLPDKKNVTG